MRVWLFGMVRAQGADGLAVRFPTAKCRDLFALLCLAGGKTLPRAEVARLLWPSANPNGQAVNLRVALYTLRQALGDATVVQADRSRIWVEPEKVRSDLAKAIALRRRSMRDPDPVVRASRLTEVVQLTRSPLMADVELSLADAARTAWRQRHLDALAQLRQLQENGGQIDEAIATAAELIEADPTQEEAVAATMRLLAGRGHRAKAVEFFRRANEQCRKRSGVGLSAEIELLANTIESGAFPTRSPAPSGEPSGGLLGGLLGGALARGAESALSLLVTEARQPVAVSNAQEMLAILADAHSRALSDSPSRVGLASAAARMAGYLNRYDEVLHWADKAISEGVPGDAERWSALLTRGFVQFTVRRWEEAYRDCQLVFDETLANPTGLFHLSALANMATFDWHQLDLDGAKTKYEEFLACVDPEEYGARPQICMARANLCFFYSSADDWEKAIEEGEAALRYARAFEYSFGECVCGPLGLAHVMTDDVAYGIATLERGVTCMHRHDYARLCQICMEYAGIALVQVGRAAEGMSVLSAIEAHRAASRHERSPAEAKLAQAAADKAGPVSIDRSYALLVQRELAAKVCELLAEVH